MKKKSQNIYQDLLSQKSLKNFSDSEIDEISLYYHNLAKAKGWWDENKEFDIIETLIYSELFEAFESWRTNSFCSSDMLVHTANLSGDEFVQYFKENIKDTIGDEIADICIRIFDWWGYCLSSDQAERNRNSSVSYKGAFPTNIVDFIRSNHSFETLLFYCEDTCNELNINLPMHIYLKGEYNKSRSYKHGNKQA